MVVFNLVFLSDLKTANMNLEFDININEFFVL